jgi:Na+/H+-dicarboxylate symporter
MMNLSTLILAALGVGILFGALLNGIFPTAITPLDHYLLTPVGDVFLRLIQFVVVPIVFCSMILGLTRIQNAAQVGRYTLKLLLCYILTSAIAVGLGMGMATLLKPGMGVTGFYVPIEMDHQQGQPLLAWLVSLVPVNPLEALSTANLLQIIFSAALMGVAIQFVGDKANRFIEFVESCYAIFEQVLALVLYVAPFGVFALISSVIATQGLDIIVRLFVYVAGLLFSTAMMISLYALILWGLRANPRHFFSSLFPALSLAFGTASSNAALPIALQNIQEDYGLRSEIASFAIPLGTALKRDGSAILQGFNALFIAQVYQVPLTTSMVLAIAVSTLLVSFSTPGVPGSALITMTTVLSAAGLPIEGVAIVAGVDRLTDGFKTVLNIVGNTTNAILLSYWEPQAEVDTPPSLALDPQTSNANPLK